MKLAVVLLIATVAGLAFVPAAEAHPDYFGHCSSDNPCDLHPCDTKCLVTETVACAKDAVDCWTH